MSPLGSPVRRHAARLIALCLVLALFGLARLPTLPDAERSELAAQFAFEREPLSVPVGLELARRRPVNPSMEQLAGWISAVGAAVALADLDGDGLPNDVCHVDPRTDLVTLAPAPGSGARYALFALDAAPLRYDSDVMAPMGCVPRDLNEDGRTDLLVYYWGRPPIAFLRRAGGSASPTAASYVPRELVPRPERWYTNAASFADLDGDGHLDLVIGNYFQDGARILDARAEVPDSMHRSMSRAYNGGRNRILRWIGASSGSEPGVEYREIEGVFEEDSIRAWTLAIGAADLDGDLLPELYFANDFGPDRLMHNRSRPGEIRFVELSGEKHLTVPSSKVLGRDSFKGMGVDFADVNADGLLDLYVSNIADEYALQESHFLWVSTGETERMSDGVAPYVESSEELGVSRSSWGWDTRFGDFNNDGVLEALQATGFVRGETDRWPELQELAMGNDELLRFPGSWPSLKPERDDLSGHSPNPFYVRALDGRFYDLAAAIGIDEPQVTRGIATADVDGDGDLDFAVANQWDRSWLYRNESPDSGAFLGLHVLLALDANEPLATRSEAGHPSPDSLGRPAIGATVRVHGLGSTPLVAQVDGGNGHSGVRSPDLHFGLGDLADDARLQVEVSWRDGRGRVHRDALELSPGWHTLWLGAATGAGAE